MSDYIPTARLRFVERLTIIAWDTAVKPTKILQQWWEEDPYRVPAPLKGEWRDVPMETEK